MKKLIVKRTKEPSFKQLQNMTQNLHLKYKVATSIHIIYAAYSTEELQKWYRVFVHVPVGSDPVSIYDEVVTWEELQDKYFALMEGE